MTAVAADGAANALRAAGYTALTEQMESAGVIVWWRLTGGFNLRALRAAWTAEGLATAWLPEPPSAPSALRRAVTEERSAHALVRSQKSGALVLVDEHEVGGELTYTNVLRVSLDVVGRVEFRRYGGGTQALEDRITSNFDKHLEQVSQADVSSWLTRMMDRLKAVPLRESGGIYFVPRFAVTDWESIVRAVRAASDHVVSYVPALRSEEAATAVLDAIALEAEKAVTAMTDEVASGELGARALQSRIGVADSVNEKLSRYEALFGARLDGLHGAITRLRASLSVAMMQAMDETAEAEA